MKAIPQDVSESTRRRNPHLYGPMPAEQAARVMASGKHPLAYVGATAADLLASISDGQRVRQDRSPKLGRWEQEWHDMVALDKRFANVRGQSLRFRLANGAWYKPDVTATGYPDGLLNCFEVKGGKRMKGVPKGVLALKVAAAQYPECRWWLVWKESGVWRKQEVLP